MTTASCYGNVGNSEDTCRIVSKFAEKIQECQLPVVIGGDFNATPNQVATWQLEGFGLGIVQPGEPTCSSSHPATVIDFFS